MRKLIDRAKPGKHRGQQEKQPVMNHQSLAGEQLVEKIQEEIGAAMYLRDDMREKFITRERLEKIWEKYPPSNIPELESLRSDELVELKRDYLLVLSILVVIGWELLRFRPVFLRSRYDRSRCDLDDKNIPFTLEQLRVMGPQRQIFHQYQLMFKPVVIEGNNPDYKQHVDKYHRLPFVAKPKLLGRGGFGDVTKRVIAPGCYVEVLPNGTRRLETDVSNIPNLSNCS